MAEIKKNSRKAFRFPSICSVSLILLILVTCASAEWPENDYRFQTGGPMHLPPIGLINAFQFSPVIMGPNEIKPGSWNVSVGLRWMNIWNLHIESDIPFKKGDDINTFPFKYGTFLMDYEVVCLTTCISHGMGEHFDFVLTIPTYYLGGGVMDGFIEGFHDLFNIGQHYRDYSERDQIRMFYVDENNGKHILKGSDLKGYNLGNIVLYSGYRFDRVQPSIAIRLGIKIPTNTGLIPTEQEGVDATLFYSMAWNFGRVYIYHGGAGIYYGDTGLKIVHFKRWRLATATTLELPVLKKVSVLAHLALESPSADFPELKDVVAELTLGLRIYGKNSRMDIGLIENLFWYDNSPDFGIQIDSTWRF